jgi:DNA integrity scanning protein DisA with diadenylate cyclase activity
MSKSQIKNRIFELLKEMGKSKDHSGLLIVFSDINNVLAKGAVPLGIRKRTLREFDEVCHIADEKATKMLRKIGYDGAVLIDKKGFIYSPSVYLNVNVFSINEDLIEPEFAARHIAALITTTTTKAVVYTLSEETDKVREFIKGKVKRHFPNERFDISPEKIKEQLIKKRIKERTISTTKFKNFLVHKVLRFQEEE